MSEEINIFALFSLYCHLLGIKIVKKSLIIEQFSSKNRSLLKKIIRYLANGEYNYLNWQIIMFLDTVFEEELIYKFVSPYLLKL